MTEIRRWIGPDVPWIGLILLPYVVLLAVVPPNGEFPTTDDFDYAATAWHLADSGQLTLSDWPAMTLVTHAGWGAIACRVFGNSFAVLRCSVCVLSFAGAMAIYGGTRAWGHSRTLAGLAAISFAVNPLTVALEYTFMTDVTGAAMSALLIACAPQARRGSTSRLAGYSVLAGAAYLARETAAIPWIMLLLGTAWGCVVRREPWRPLLCLALPAGLMIAAYQYWLREFLGVPYNRSQPALDPAALLSDPQRPVYLVTGLALALAPLAVVALVSRARGGRSRWWLLPIAAALCGVAFVGAGVEVTAPYRQELFDLGVRPPEAPEGRVPAALRGPTLSVGSRDVSVVRAAATGGAWLFAAVLGVTLIVRRSDPDELPTSSSRRLPVATLTCLSMIALYLVTRGFSDRYLFSLVPPALLMLAERIPPNGFTRPAICSGWIAVTAVSIASLIGIQDAMQRSRAFWSAAGRLRERQVGPFEIDAGIAFGGMYRFNPLYRGEANRGPFWNLISDSERGTGMASVHPLSTTLNRRYRISFDDEEFGYRPIDSVPFESWFRSGEVRIFLRYDQVEDDSWKQH